MDEERKGMDNFPTLIIEAAMPATKMQSHHLLGYGFAFIPLNKKTTSI